MWCLVVLPFDFDDYVGSSDDGDDDDDRCCGHFLHSIAQPKPFKKIQSIFSEDFTDNHLTQN